MVRLCIEVDAPEPSMLGMKRHTYEWGKRDFFRRERV